MTDCAVLMPVGPGEQEVGRALDTAASVFAWEPRARWLVMVDDGAHDRRLADLIVAPAGVQVISLRSVRWDLEHAALIGRHNKSSCISSATQTGLRWIAEHAPGTLVVRLDTDALVVSPFAEKLLRAFRAHPGVGIFGLFDRGLDGTSHEHAFRFWRRGARKLGAPVRIYRRPPVRGRHVEQALWGPAAMTRRQFRRAIRHGYRAGEFVLAAACALAPSMIAAMSDAGDLAQPARWLSSPVAEDVMLAIGAYAVGFRLGGLISDGEPFGLMHVGLADTPERLLARGFSFIHSVKNDPRFSEDEIRKFFARHRSGVLER